MQLKIDSTKRKAMQLKVEAMQQKVEAYDQRGTPYIIPFFFLYSYALSILYCSSFPSELSYLIEAKNPKFPYGSHKP